MDKQATNTSHTLNYGDDEFMTKQPFRLTLLCLVCLSISVTAKAEVVFIPDPNLRAIIENKVGKAPGAAISPADMSLMTELKANNENIRNLTGLEYATNLMVLWLAENNISHLVPIAGLTRLIELDLSANSISNIAPLARLTNLRGLYLGENYISNISPLAGLTQLRYLILAQNRISNILYLRGLTQLEVLGLWTNSVSDISPLARLTSLTGLDLGANAIADISALAGLTNLAELWINDNSISDLSPLVANSGLRTGDTVDVDSNPLSHAAVNSHIPTLRSRGVTVELQHITAQQNAVNIPDPNLRNAIEQILRKARGAAITAADMRTLVEVGATSENVTNLTGLEHATNLKKLWLQDNFISDLSPIAGLTRLTVLDLRDNLISNISPLARLTSLTGLGLGQNSITNISPLAGLTQLNILGLSDNSISDLWPLVANSGLRNGDEINVKDNPLSHRSLNTHIPTLQSRGVIVHFDQGVAQPQNVNIPDSNLRNAIEQLLGKARGSTITADDMARLSILDATEENIRNLTGLEHATNLTELWLRDNFISDISPIAGLTRLTVLDLRDNLISNISPLARLTSLIGLGLGQNSITNISPLARLTSLIELGLGQNNITDISPLAGLTRLNILGLSDNSISDLWPLVANSGLRNGDEVNVTGNPLSHRSLNTHIPTLQSRGVNVQFDQGVAQPQNVNIPDSNLRNALEQILGKARGATITVADMQTLVIVSANSKNIYNLTGLEHATNLTELGLADNLISDISPIAGLTRLTVLDLRDNSISDFSALARLTNLTALGLADNLISDISPLALLTNLTVLNLAINNISNIAPLAGLTNLTHLNLDENSISDISPLARLTRLTELYLQDNSISDLWPLVANSGLGNGDKLNVKENPLNDLSFNTHIPTLESRGGNV